MKYGKVGSIKREILRQLFPWENCLLCGEPNLRIIRNIDYIKSQGYICPGCKSNLEDYKKCTQCGTFIKGHQIMCHWCEDNQLPYLANAVGFAPYKSRLRQYILDLKYNDKQALARPMGEMIGRAVLQQKWCLDAVVAVPLFAAREQDRGYNQAELLALNVCDKLDLPYLKGVVARVKETKIQNKLTRAQREANLKDVFAPGKNAGRVAGKTILLVDDIITSGSTMCNCAKVLLESGAVAVYGGAVAAARDKNRDTEILED